MEQLILKPLNHRGHECIGIYFNRNNEIQNVLQSKLGAHWSSSQVCWYISCTAEKYKLLRSHLKDKALFNVDELRIYLLNRCSKNSLPASFEESANLKKTKEVVKKKPNKLSPLSEENKEALRLFEQQMVLKGFTKNTMRTYSSEFSQFLALLGSNSAVTFSVPRLKDYFQYCHSVLNLTESTIHSKINAIKFYYEQVLGREKFFWDIPRPKKPLILPKVINKEKIAELINSIENLKHKTIIMLTYACGLRVEEVVSIKIRNIDGKRQVLYIELGKNKKDRVLSLSPNMLIMLREYYTKYKPKDYLFEGQSGKGHLSARSIQNVLQKAKKETGVILPGNMHLLRHSFATHLLDKGVDVVFIQKLLGHNDIRTTLRYLHVTNKDLVHIISPLEDITGLLKK